VSGSNRHCRGQSITIKRSAMITLKQIRKAEDQAMVSRLSNANLLSEKDRGEYLNWLEDQLEPLPGTETYREG